MYLRGVLNGKLLTSQDGKTSIFLCEDKIFFLLKGHCPTKNNKIALTKSHQIYSLIG